MLETVLPVDSQPNAYSLVVAVVKQEIKQVLIDVKDKLGFPSGISGKEPACQCRRHKRCGFDPWVGKIPWRMARQPTPVFSPGKIPWTEEPGRLKTIELQKNQTRLND